MNRTRLTEFAASVGVLALLASATASPIAWAAASGSSLAAAPAPEAKYQELGRDGAVQHVQLVVNSSAFTHLFFRLGGTPTNGGGNQSLHVSKVSGPSCTASALPPNQVACAGTSGSLTVKFDVSPLQANNDSNKLVLDNPAGHGARALFVIGPIVPKLELDAKIGTQAARDVSDSSADAVIGQSVSLTAKTPDGKVDPKVTWTELSSPGAGSLVDTYKPSLTSATPKFLSAGPFKKQTLTFFFGRSGAYKFQVTDPGIADPTTVDFNVSTPGVSALSYNNPSRFRVRANSGAAGFLFGGATAEGTDPFAYKWTVTPGAGGSGHIGVIQLISRHASDGACVTANATNALDLAKSKKVYFGRGLVPATTAFFGNDDPAIPVQPLHGSYADDVTLVSYLVYVPDAGIPVELAALRYHHQAHNVFSPALASGWTLFSDAQPSVQSAPLSDPPLVTYSSNLSPAVDLCFNSSVLTVAPPSNAHIPTDP